MKTNRMASPASGRSADLGLSPAEIRGYSFVRAIRALAFPEQTRYRDEAAFELEVSHAAAAAAGRETRGIFVPNEVLRDRVMFEQRDLTVGTATAGGYTVGTQVLGGSFIEDLRNRLVLNRVGARVLTGLTGNLVIPKVTGGATAYWVGESGVPTESTPTFGQVNLTPKTCGAWTDISRKLLLQSSVDVEMFVRGDLASIVALEIDRAGLYGEGAGGEPLGVANTTGIKTVSFGTPGAPTYAEMVSMETQLGSANADVGALGYVVDAAARGTLKTTLKDAGSGQFVWEPDNTVGGYKAVVSNQVVTNDVWFANWSDLVVGMWSGLDLLVDPYSQSTSGTVRVVALQDLDYAVRHPESFCLGQ